MPGTRPDHIIERTPPGGGAVSQAILHGKRAGINYAGNAIQVANNAGTNTSVTVHWTFENDHVANAVLVIHVTAVDEDTTM